MTIELREHSGSSIKLAKQNKKDWIFLVVQWLKLCAPNAGGQGSLPGQGNRSHTPQLKTVQPSK